MPLAQLCAYCPRCKAEPVEFPSIWQIKCVHCGLTGPKRKTRRGAFSAWKIRCLKYLVEKSRHGAGAPRKTASGAADPQGESR